MKGEMDRMGKGWTETGRVGKATISSASFKQRPYF